MGGDTKSARNASARTIRAVMMIATLAACGRTPDHTSERAPDVHATQWLIGPTPAEDLIHLATTHDSLVAKFGAANVLWDSVYTGEGMFDRATIIYPNDSSRLLSIVWGDTVRRAHPTMIRVSGSHSQWRVYPGVSLGTPLSAIDSLNGRSIVLAGFGWDYSGTVYGYERGKLDSLWRPDTTRDYTVMLRLGNDTIPANLQDLANQVMSEREYPSTHPAMVALKPRVYQILVRPR